MPQDSSKSIQDISYFIQLSSENQADYRLPYPLRFETAIKVSCKIPRQIQLFLMKGENHTGFGVNDAKVYNPDLLYLRNKESYRFQIYAFDAFNRPFYNFSTMSFVWSIESNGLLSLEVIFLFV